jgi:hypothetical protein
LLCAWLIWIPEKVDGTRRNFKNPSGPVFTADLRFVNCG